MSTDVMYFRTHEEAMREKAAMDTLLEQQLRQQGKEQLACDLGGCKKSKDREIINERVEPV